METKSNDNSNYNKCQNWQKQSLVRLLPGLELISVGRSSEVNHLIFKLFSRIFSSIINAKFIIYPHLYFYENSNDVSLYVCIYWSFYWLSCFYQPICFVWRHCLFINFEIFPVWLQGKMLHNLHCWKILLIFIVNELTRKSLWKIDL